MGWRGNQSKAMPSKHDDVERSSSELVDIASKVLRDIAAEPVPPQITALAQALQSAIEGQSCDSLGGKAPDAGQELAGPAHP
jgi:hypothetical protein